MITEDGRLVCDNCGEELPTKTRRASPPGWTVLPEEKSGPVCREITMWQFRSGKYEARYWNSNGFPIAIVARVTNGVDWAAYIGGSESEASEEETCVAVADRGAKLREADARHFFPRIELPYRD